MEVNMSNDCELRLSIAGGSGCDCSCVLECPYKHFLKYEQGWRLRRMPKYFAMGIVVHEAFFARDHGLFRAKWENGVIFDDTDEDAEGWPIDRDEDEIEADVELAGKMLDELEKEQIEVIDSETKLSTPIMDPDNGKTPSHLEGVVVAGRRDMIEQRKGGEQLSDLKTSSKRWSKDQPLGMIQLPTYRYLEACNGDPVHDRGDYVVVTKTKKPVVERYPVDMGDSDFFAVYQQFKASAETILACRKSGEWPKHRHNCLGMYMQLCDYHPLCFPERYSDPEAEVNAKLERRG
jgi:hypothetical protein